MSGLESLIPNLGAVGAVIYVLIHLVTKTLPKQNETFLAKLTEHDQRHSADLGGLKDVISKQTDQIEALMRACEKQTDQIEALTDLTRALTHAVRADHTNGLQRSDNLDRMSINTAVNRVMRGRDQDLAEQVAKSIQQHLGLDTRPPED